ncbi:MAG: nuclease-related domain-containing protein [Maribacter sp.]
MTLVYGQLESLKKLRETLDQKRISRFNTIGQLNKFIKNYEREKEELFFKIKQEFELELDTMQTEAFTLQQNYDTLKTNTETRLKESISKLKKKCETLRSNPAKNAVLELGNWYLLQILLGKRFILEKSYYSIIWLQTLRAKKHLKELLKKVNAHTSNSQSILSARFAAAFEKLEYTKSVVTDINPLIGGAIGEHLVAKELEKLSETDVLFNDFSLSFNPPIYNKNDHDRISSIQIDHLLVTRAGIFIIETKNWSKESLERLDLRSPIKQIQRTSYALFVVLNSKKAVGSRILKQHHWGNKELPIRNVIAMINHKPKEKFKYVAIKKLKELNRYIKYYEPIFDESEVRSIAEHLGRLKNL